MMEKLDPTVTPASPRELSCPSSSSSPPSCASVEQHSPHQNKASSDAGLHPDNKTELKADLDIPTAASRPSTITTTTMLNNHHTDVAAAPEPIIMETEEDEGEGEEEEEERHRGPASTGATAASASRSPTLSSPPPLLPAPAKTSPCPLPPPISTSSSPLPPHIPVISLGHSKPPLPLPTTPLTALHPIPNLLHGDLRRTQLTCLPVVSPGTPGSSVVPGGPSAPSPGPLFPQQYLSAHPFFTR